MEARKSYPTDLSNAEWDLIKDQVPPPKPGGRPPDYERREIVNAIRYVIRSGCAWRLLPHDLPPWQITYHYFWEWRRQGVWESIHDKLRGDLREKLGRNREPSAAILDSQSVKTTEKGGPTVTMRVKKSMAASATSS